MNAISNKKIAELERVYVSYAEAVRTALDVLLVQGPDSVAFLQADAAADLLWVETRSLLIPKAGSR
jgi:hypothetical protein